MACPDTLPHEGRRLKASSGSCVHPSGKTIKPKRGILFIIYTADKTQFSCHCHSKNWATSPWGQLTTVLSGSSRNLGERITTPHERENCAHEPAILIDLQHISKSFWIWEGLDDLKFIKKTACDYWVLSGCGNPLFACFRRRHRLIRGTLFLTVRQ